MMSPNESPLIFLLGAGSSKAFDIPDIRAFYEEFKKQLVQEGREITLLEKLEQRRNSQADLETLLTDLGDLEAAVKTVSGVTEIPKELGESARDAKLLHDRLMKFIIMRCEKFDEQRAIRAYKPILELGNVNPIWIFTTNYDRILEYCCEMSKIPFSDGFVKEKDDIYLWNDAFDKPLRLGKIHGSINWFRDETLTTTIIKLDEPHPFPTSEFKIHYKNYNFSASMIIPTFEKYISDLPFFALQTRLIDAIRSARVCFVIGTKLRDAHLRSLLLTNIDRITVVAVGHNPEIIRSTLNDHPNVLGLKCDFEQFAIASRGYLSDLMTNVRTGDVRELTLSFLGKVSETIANLRQQPVEGGTVEELLSKLDSSSYVEIANAARRLGESGVTKAIPQLSSLLDHPHEYVRTQAVSALGLLKAQETLTTFRELLFNDKSEDVRVEVALALREIHNETADKILAEASGLLNLSPYLRSLLTS